MLECSFTALYLPECLSVCLPTLLCQSVGWLVSCSNEPLFNQNQNSAQTHNSCLILNSHCSFNKTDFYYWYSYGTAAEVGTPPAPALVADSLSATSLALEWQNPDAFVRLSRGRVDPLESYLVQFRYEENVGDWKLCNNQSIGHNSTINVENLQPYTKYRVSWNVR